MAGSPWTLQSTKRRQPTVTPGARKRARISDDVDIRQSASRRPKDQTTLTQIQWVASPTEDPQDGTNISGSSHGQDENVKAAKRKRRRTKEKSTLTQMDWLGGPHLEDHEVPKDWMTRSHKATSRPSAVSPTNVIHADLPKNRKQRSSPTRQNWNSSLLNSIEHDSQEYTPPSRKRKNFSILRDSSATPRRKSKRIASRMPIEMEDGPHVDPASSQLEHASAIPKLSFQSALEVRDSVEGDDDIGSERIRFTAQTPPRNEIPSSQTPETVKPRKYFSDKELDQFSKLASRKPLQEKSGNILSRSHAPMRKGSNEVDDETKSSPRGRKIRVLKVPTQVKGRFMDDTKNKDLLDLDTRTDRPVETVSTRKKSSNQDDVSPDPPSSAPARADVPPDERRIKKHVERAHANSSTSLVDQDPSYAKSQAKSVANPSMADKADGAAGEVSDMMLLDQKIPDDQSSHGASIPNLTKDDEDDEDGNDDDDDDDEDSVLGSCVANDTQFNVALMERISSPNLDPSSEEATQYKSPERILSNLKRSGEAGLMEMETLIPIPKLVDRPTSMTSQNRSDEIDDSDDDPDLLPLKPALASHGTAAKASSSDATQIPPSSSPLLPCFKTPTLRGIQPASIPHPSQISTQEPTQGFPLSLLPSVTQCPKEVDNITIKDSSSIRLSQVPQYSSQSQHLNLCPVGGLEGELDELDDLDLDPSSTVQLRQSARKTLDLLHEDAGSPLRSIHPSSDNSKDQDVAVDPPPSPSQLRRRKQIDGDGEAQGQLKTQAQAETDVAVKSGVGKNMPHLRTQRQHELPTREQGSVTDSDATTLTVTSPISLLPSSSPPPTLLTKPDPIPGFDNDTQSNFTHNGHITAAYVRRQRATGAWPDWFVPEPFQIADWRQGRRAPVKRSREG